MLLGSARTLPANEPQVNPKSFNDNHLPNRWSPPGAGLSGAPCQTQVVCAIQRTRDDESRIPSRAVKSAMAVFDTGYHMNHRRNGIVMFNPATRSMLEGIGHYRCASTADGRIVMDVDAPYHCDFDRGIMMAWALRFERTAVMTHIEPGVCRKTGALRCRYELTWK